MKLGLTSEDLWGRLILQSHRLGLLELARLRRLSGQSAVPRFCASGISRQTGVSRGKGKVSLALKVGHGGFGHPGEQLGLFRVSSTIRHPAA
jgi:hypothetical protein